MTDEQNDSPAFRLRPRRSAPKSYYAVRLEYSANPAAFIRERPRPKRKAFTQKSGSNSTHLSGKVTASGHSKPNVITREEREQEEKRLLLHRDISESITTNIMISPFMQRLQIDELEPDSIYEHNYITLKIEEVEQSHNRRLLSCSCVGVENHDTVYAITVKLHNEYADTDIVKEGKILSITKFRTSSLHSSYDEQGGSESNRLSNHAQQATSHNIANKSCMNSGKLSPSMATQSQEESTPVQIPSPTSTSIKIETHDYRGRPSPSSSVTPSDHEFSSHTTPRKPKCEADKTETGHTILLPFYIIVKYDELVERSTSNSNKGASLAIARSASPIGSASVYRRPVIPFISVSDMIEQPIEPYVEICPSSPGSCEVDRNHDDENQESKKVKFTATV